MCGVRRFAFYLVANLDGISRSVPASKAAYAALYTNVLIKILIKISKNPFLMSTSTQEATTCQVSSPSGLGDSVMSQFHLAGSKEIRGETTLHSNCDFLRDRRKTDRRSRTARVDPKTPPTLMNQLVCEPFGSQVYIVQQRIPRLPLLDDFTPKRDVRQ
ncbi:hypothetical protein AVEN_41794-1 [Araneus ventricosus]|uniref:Uncharacterized protein n=1 Tax=Araneus ventricosus TaxID=182803 RepID=A0A4Y2ADK0_ARAVE|nr:hypothetical protein AVEN_41794-1 [Araneus ventricosus]